MSVKNLWLTTKALFKLYCHCFVSVIICCLCLLASHISNLTARPLMLPGLLKFHISSYQNLHVWWTCDPLSSFMFRWLKNQDGLHNRAKFWQRTRRKSKIATTTGSYVNMNINLFSQKLHTGGNTCSGELWTIVCYISKAFIIAWFPFQMTFLPFNSNTTGATSGAGIAYPSWALRVHPPVFSLLNL